MQFSNTRLTGVAAILSGLLGLAIPLLLLADTEKAQTQHLTNKYDFWAFAIAIVDHLFVLGIGVALLRHWNVKYLALFFVSGSAYICALAAGMPQLVLSGLLTRDDGIWCCGVSFGFFFQMIFCLPLSLYGYWKQASWS